MALYYNNSYYYGEDAKRSTGLQTIDGIQYLFDASGTLAVSRMVVLANVNYYCDTNGAAHEMPNNQWYKGDDGNWYYVKDGEVLKECTAQIDGKWYQFDYAGRLNTDNLSTDESGALRINSWVYDGTYWHYYGEDGEAYRYGVYEISDAKYYSCLMEITIMWKMASSKTVEPIRLMASGMGLTMMEACL